MRSAIPKDVKMSLKVMVNKEKTKVPFAEANSKSAEVILSFLMLPLGEIVRVFEEHYLDKKPVVGSLTPMYRHLTTLRSDYFWTDGGKNMLLNPSNSFMSGPVKHFRCGDMDCKKKSFRNVSIYYDSGTCDCGKPLNRAMGEIEPKPQAGGDGILVEGLHFLVTDDLQLAPYEPGSMMETLVYLGIVVTEGAEQLNVTLGYNEIVDLLKRSLLSKTPLTDVILCVINKNMGYVLEDILLDKIELESTSSKRMTVTALMQKSTNKLLFVKGREDFVDFILSFLTIPLGGVVSLLRGKTCFKGIDNLYKSTSNLIKDKHFITGDAKRRLQEPQLPPYYVSKNQIFSLSEQIVNSIYYYESITDSSDQTIGKGSWMRYKDPKGDQGCYVKPGMFKISDDLTFLKCFFSNSAILSKLKIPPSDVKEMEVQIGLKEGLSILKAALRSTTALADGLVKHITKASVASNSAQSDGLHNKTSNKRPKTKVSP
ncbi:uncharacterized protein LOC130996608 [Salvia miltiorrhiza]|uniref:uncharacterized protein LOC130996608 n=1 Tax=Salvia miltiorrhiza TaxID=226208 RepID=UPI0025AD743B|nr:uncharacterized protein LOC130996608 [Salvia miltiorrhiza]